MNKSSDSLLCIAGARIATMIGDEILEGMNLWVADGRVLAVLPANSPAPRQGPVDRIDGRNRLVMPGMVNSHSHSYSSLLRGTVPGAPLDLFVMEAMARRAPADLNFIRVAVLLQALDMLKHGITAAVDHFRHGAVPTVEAIGAAFGAYKTAGVRAAIAPMYEDRVYVDSMPIDRSRLPQSVQDRWGAMKTRPPEEYFAMLEEVVAQFHKRDRMQVMIGVDGPQRCTIRLLEMTGDFSAKHGIGLHTHLLEAKTQALMAPTDNQGSFVAHLDRFGLIGPKSSLAHFVWGNDRDIELAAERKVNVVNNPVSNLLLGSGLQPTARLLEAGINVALGCDSLSSTTTSMFEQAKTSMLLSRISQPDCSRWMTAPQAMRMASAHGGLVLGDPDIGVIRPGAHADLTLIDLTHANYRPLGDIWNHLAIYENGSAVDTVLVGGEIVLKGGRSTRINEEDLLAEADDFAARNQIDNAALIATTRAERPAFEPLIVEALQRPTAVSRFASLT
jgi:5-methylthioadenosine/S-adenosylhomocysteine deaminase